MSAGAASDEWSTTYFCGMDSAIGFEKRNQKSTRRSPSSIGRAQAGAPVTFALVAQSKSSGPNFQSRKRSASASWPRANLSFLPVRFEPAGAGYGATACL